MLSSIGGGYASVPLVKAASPAQGVSSSAFIEQSSALVRFASPLTTPAQAALLIDLSTGEVLYEKNAFQRMHPSSMTKILTVYLVFEALKKGELKLQDTLIVSANAARQGGSKMFLKPEQSVSYEDILKGILALSGNDACTAVAEALAGSEELFASMMNEKAQELGAKDSHFSNASGLPSPQHWSTCYDLAQFACKTLDNFPEEYKRYYNLQSFTSNGITQPNRNVLLRKGYADGMKTGYTQLGKYGIVASSERKGRRLLLVINGLETEAKRNAEAIRLLNWGFQFFQGVTFFKEGQKVLDIPVWKRGTLPLVAEKKIALSIPMRLVPKMTVTVRYYGPLTPPIQKGQRLGMLVVTLPQHPPLEFPLVAGEAVEKPGIIGYILRLFSKGL